MKPSWEWTENDLLGMMKMQTQESLNLEFKQSGALEDTEKKKDEISKDVSSFANSEGGDILYGVSEAGTAPSRFGNLENGIDPSKISPESLEQIINSRIHKKIDGIRITPIELKATHPGRYIYAVNIPMSNTAHQASDKRYYKRFNFQSVPMDDYEITDIQNRKTVPNLLVDGEILKSNPLTIFDFKRWLGVPNGSLERNSIVFSTFDLRIWLKNMGKSVAKHSQIILTFENLDILKTKGFLARLDELRDKPSLQWGDSDGVVHPGHAVQIADIRLRIKDIKQSIEISCEVSAEDFPTFKSEYKFRNSFLLMPHLREMDGKKIPAFLSNMPDVFK